MSLSSVDQTCISRVLILAFSVALSSCAALQPPDVNGPHSNLPSYPVATSDFSTREGTTLAWQQLAQRYGLPPEDTVDLNALTGTIQSLPANLRGSIVLPRVGSGRAQTEEETRESLRRFIVDWQSLIGANPSQLSLVERRDSGEVKVARYEQRPFRHPLRGAYGSLTIRFQSDRRVIDISSTCLRDAERLQSALAAVTPVVTQDEAETLVKKTPIVASAGEQQRFNLPGTATVTVRQLVVYAEPVADRQDLELHLAWEIDVANGPIKTIYLDVISRQIIAIA